MKYILENIETKETHLCEKKSIDGFDYFVNDEKAIAGNWALYGGLPTKKIVDASWTTDEKIIATTNPNIDAPKIVDRVEVLARNRYKNHSKKDDRLSLDEQIQRSGGFIVGYKEGFTSSKEETPFSTEDMIEFAEWISNNQIIYYGNYWVSTKIHYSGCAYLPHEFLNLWLEQKPTKLYYK